MNTTKITKNDDNEYRIRLFVDGKYQAGADYYTNDKQDAIDTAKHMKENGGISDKTTDFAKSEQADFDQENKQDNSDNDDDEIMYDVCNDYTLDTMTTKFNLADYQTKKHPLGILYIHKKYNEIHYLKGKQGMNGIRI